MAECAQAEGVVAFGEPDPFFVEHQWAVAKPGWLESQRAVKKDLTGGGKQQIAAANHFRDAHRGVVHDDGELICGHVVVSPDDEVAEVLAGDETLFAAVFIAEGNGFAIGHAETPGETS